MENLKSLFKYLSNYKDRLIKGFIFLILTNAFALTIPWLLKISIDSIKEKVEPKELLNLAILIVTATTIQGIFRFIARKTVVGTAREIEYDLRNDLFWHLQKLSISFYNKIQTGEIMSRASQDFNQVRSLLGPGVLHFINTIIVYSSTVTLMLIIDVKLTLYALLPCPLLFIIVKKFTNLIHDRFHEVEEQFTRLTEKIQENLHGIRVVKAYTMYKREVDVFDKLNREYIDKNLSLVRVEGIFHPIIGIVGGLGTVIVLWAGGREVIEGRLTLGELVAFNGYLAMLIWPTIAIAWIMNLLQRGLVSMERINEVMKEEPKIKDNEKTLNIKSIEGDIEFRNLSFSYNSDSNGIRILEGINLKINRGEKVAIVGQIGSGKSTLINLIQRIFEVEDNMLFISGIDINKIPIETLRKSIGYVPQETFLFSDTIRENIAYGVLGIDDAIDNAEIERAAFVSDILDEIKEFSQGFGTIVGERGITLSGGQKQRIAISRAVIIKPKILILDDALSNVDVSTEERIMERLFQETKDVTCIIITHRLSTVKNVHRIIVIEDGKIVETGSHRELMEKGKVYPRLYRKQQLLFELDEMQ